MKIGQESVVIEHLDGRGRTTLAEERSGMCMEIGAGVTKQRLGDRDRARGAGRATAGCAAGRAYRRGQEAARAGDWDAAVTHYTRAVQENPDSPEYKIALERAMQSSAQEHISRARQLEEKDQLDAALLEYRKAIEMDCDQPARGGARRRSSSA